MAYRSLSPEQEVQYGVTPGLRLPCRQTGSACFVCQMAHGASALLDWRHPHHVLICQNAEPARYTHYCSNNTNILGPARDTHVVGVSALIRPGALM